MMKTTSFKPNNLAIFLFSLIIVAIVSVIRSKKCGCASNSNSINGKTTCGCSGSSGNNSTQASGSQASVAPPASLVRAAKPTGAGTVMTGLAFNG